jgi:O-antigen/teichoic acid export membrane protein
MGTRHPLVQTAVYAASLVVSKGISLVMIPFMTAHLGPAEYGTLEALVALADVGGVVLGLGLADTLFRFGSKGDNPDRSPIAATLIGLSIAIAIVTLIAGQLVAPLMLPTLPPGVALEQLRLLMISLALTACIQVPFAWLRSRESALEYFGYTIGKIALQATLIVIAVRDGWGVTGVLAAGAVSDVVLSTTLLLRQILVTGIRLPDRAGAKSVLVYALPLVLSGIGGFALGTFDRWILAHEVPPAELALYGLAAKFGMATALLLQPFDLWWYPRRIRLLDEPDGYKRTAATAGIGATVAILAASAASLAGPALINLLTPPEYHAAGRYVPWLAMIAVLHASCSLVNVGCYNRRTTTLPMAINLTAAGIAVTLYLILIPRLGVMGAIHATWGAQVCRVILFAGFGHRSAPVPYPVFRAALLALAGAAAVSLGGPLYPTFSDVMTAGVLMAGLVTLAMLLGLLPRPYRLGLRPA